MTMFGRAGHEEDRQSSSCNIMSSSPPLEGTEEELKPKVNDGLSSKSHPTAASSTTSLRMEESLLFALAQPLEIPRAHLTVGLANWLHLHKDFQILLKHRRLPNKGWSDLHIQQVLLGLSSLDTNAKTTPPWWCGVGEREGRCYSSLVQNRHYGLCHGIGRSGDLKEAQPKAVGSTLLAKLTVCLTLDAIRRGSGLNAQSAAKHGILLPLCTGMSMSLILQSLKQQYQPQPQQRPPDNGTEEDRNETNLPRKNVVLWSRIDQKSCFKAIATAGLECVVVPTRQSNTNNDQVETDLDAMQGAMATYRNRIVAVVTTTSCFAPRVADSIDCVAKLCQEHGLPHVINHAYGLQCAATNKLVNRACAVGRVDAIVCSTDKNFLVPVGGAIVLSPHHDVIDRIGKLYAGRASSSSIIDLFITLLSMGLEGYQTVLQNRVRLIPLLQQGLASVATKHGERLLQCNNSISFAITLDTLTRSSPPPNLHDGGDDCNDTHSHHQAVADAGRGVTQFGAMLFHRCVSGTRVVPRDEIKTIGTTQFVGFGSSVESYPHAYLTAACAVGLTEEEVHEFLKRLDKCFVEWKKQETKKRSTTTT